MNIKKQYKNSEITLNIKIERVSERTPMKSAQNSISSQYKMFLF